MPVELQNRIFKYFTDTLSAVVSQARRSGCLDLGILDLGSAGESVTMVKKICFKRRHATGIAPTELHTVYVERGMDWQTAIDKRAEMTRPRDGFYISYQIHNDKQTAILATALDPPSKKKGEKISKKEQMYQIYRPSTGGQVRPESLADIQKRYKKTSRKDAEKAWCRNYTAAATICSHAYWGGDCRNKNTDFNCEVGLRRRTYNVLSGGVLGVWARVERVLTARSSKYKMQVVRFKTHEGIRIVGILIPKNDVESLKRALSSDAEKVDEIIFESSDVKK